MRVRALAGAFAAVLVFAACGSDDETDPADDGAPTTSETTVSETTTAESDTTAMDHSQEDMEHAEGEPDAAAADVESGFAELTNGHHAEMELAVLPPAEQAELDAQLAITREVAAKYATLADAKAAGYRRAGPFSPGLGIHYTITSAAALNADGVMNEEDLRNPLSIIYQSHEDDAPIVGFMYYAMTSEAPEGFVGDNDVWHHHTSVCIKATADGIDAPFGADLEVPESLCTEAGGTMLEQTQYMVHVWTAPGYEVPDADGGVFGEVNRKLTCSDGSYHILEMEQWIDYPLNVCESNPL